MAQRRLHIPQIGEVVATKRRGSKNIKLSINPAGQVLIGLPYWTPYQAAYLFAKSKADWIRQQQRLHAPRELKNGSRIGKIHRLHIYKTKPRRGLVETTVTASTISVRTELASSDTAYQRAVLRACEDALRKETEHLIIPRLAAASRQYGLPYNKATIRRLTSRWGSCSSAKNISLSLFLAQLPWELIDYVILHELTHTRIGNHSREFWGFVESIMPNARQLRKDIKSYKPRVEPQALS